MSISPNIPRYFNAKLAFLKITKQTPLKRKRLFQPSIFRCQLAVSFREGNFSGFCLGQTESNKNSPAVKFAPANPSWRMASGGAACYATTTAWMSQEVSKWLVNGLFHLLINGIFLGYNPLIRSPLIHPLPSQDMQVVDLPVVNQAV